MGGGLCNNRRGWRLLKMTGYIGLYTRPRAINTVFSLSPLVPKEKRISHHRFFFSTHTHAAAVPHAFVRHGPAFFFLPYTYIHSLFYIYFFVSPHPIKLAVYICIQEPRAKLPSSTVRPRVFCIILFSTHAGVLYIFFLSATPFFYLGLINIGLVGWRRLYSRVSL
jgi:hypothetical protein